MTQDTQYVHIIQFCCISKCALLQHKIIPQYWFTPHNKPSRIGDTGDELVASIINNKLDDGNEVHYDDVKQAILDTTSLTPPTRSHGPARTSVGNSAVQRILNKYNFTVGKAKASKQRAGIEANLAEFQ